MKVQLRASSYEPGNQAGSASGTNFVICSYGKFQPGRPGWNSRNKTKMVEHNLVSFATVVALWTLVTLLIKVIRILPSGNTRQKLGHFGRYVANAKLFCQKSFVPLTRAGVFIWENSHPGYRDLGRKNRDLGKQASPDSHMNTSKFLRRKEWRGEISESELARLPSSYEEAIRRVRKDLMWKPD